MTWYETVDGKPFVQVLALWKGHCQSEVTAAQSGLCILLQLILFRSLGDVLLWFECLAFTPVIGKKLSINVM